MHVNAQIKCILDVEVESYREVDLIQGLHHKFFCKFYHKSYRKSDRMGLDAKVDLNVKLNLMCCLHRKLYPPFLKFDRMEKPDSKSEPIRKYLYHMSKC